MNGKDYIKTQDNTEYRGILYDLDYALFNCSLVLEILPSQPEFWFQKYLPT